MRKLWYVALVLVLTGMVIAACGPRTTDGRLEEERCIDSGGTVKVWMCCTSTEDFPDLCGVGPCGCAPENSHEVRVCDCGPGRCFDGEECVREP
jgi:hypothetical protein